MLTVLLEEARSWLVEQGHPIVAELTDDRRLICLTHAMYYGGWPQFIDDCGFESHDGRAVTWLLMVRKFGLDFANRIFWMA